MRKAYLKMEIKQNDKNVLNWNENSQNQYKIIISLKFQGIA